MSIGLGVNVAIVVALCAGLFVMLAWVWAKALEGRPVKARRRGVGPARLISTPLVLVALAATTWPRHRVPHSELLFSSYAAVVLSAIMALVLFDQDLRRRAEDPPTRHRLTAWGIAGMAAIVIAVVSLAAPSAVETGDLAGALQPPMAMLVFLTVAGLDILLAQAIRRRWHRRAAEARIGL